GLEAPPPRNRRDAAPDSRRPGLPTAVRTSPRTSQSRHPPPLRPCLWPPAPRNHRSSSDFSPEASSRDMSSAPTTPPSVDKVDGFSRKSVRKARQKRSQSSSQFRSQGKPIELTPLPLLKASCHVRVLADPQ
uniref:Protein phosphatase 2 regulatory subunit B'epsilon n=1 Tax=Equus caballus TaxID=9796 RepID=A0A9L0S487_HORSE